MKKIILIVSLVFALLLSSCNQVEKQKEDISLDNEQKINTSTGTIKNEIENSNSIETQSGTWKIVKTKINENIVATLITDSSVKSIALIKEQLFPRIKSETFLAKAKFIELDYSNEKDKEKINKLMKETWLKYLPIVHFNTNKLFDNWVMTNSMIKTNSGYSLYVWARYNPITKVEEEVEFPKELQRKIQQNK